MLIPPANATAASGDLVRVLDAAPYRGQAVRLRAAVRLDNPAPGDRAQLWMRVERPNGEMGFYDNMGDRPIASGEWGSYQIAGEVAADARQIAIGVTVTGKARVWVDSASFEQTPATADPATRAAIEHLYARVDDAYGRGDAEAVGADALPDAQVTIAGASTPLVEIVRQVKQDMAQGARYQSHSAVTALRAGVAEAVVTVNNQSTVTSPAGSRTAVSVSRDTWTKTPAGWKLRASVLIGTWLGTPSTGPEAARPVVAEVQRRARPLPEGMAALGAALGDARIVVLGQASYGTREFFEINRQAVQYLVTERGFTVIAIGANWAEARAVDRYIKTGEGDPRAVLDALNAWPWQSREMLDAVEWMRRYNAAPGPHPLLSFAGFDAGLSPVAERIVLDYLNAHAPQQAGPAEKAYGELRVPERAAAGAAQVASYLSANHRQLVAESSAASWLEARQAAAVCYQARQMQLPGKGPRYRAEAMAGNVEWLAAERHPTEKIVVWTHNAHAGASPGSMAAWLRQRYGKALYSVGFAFQGGAVRAVENGGLIVRRMPPAAAGTGDAVLGAAGIPEFFLDLARVPADSSLGRWLGEPHLFRQVEAMWDEAPAPRALSQLYDGLIFVEESHATEPM